MNISGRVSGYNMEELTLITKQEAGIASIDNFDELKQALQKELAIYKNMAYTPDSMSAARKDKAALNKLRKMVEDKRKEIKRVIMEPYTIIEAQAKELVSLIDEPLGIISDFIRQEENFEKEAKRIKIEDYFFENTADLNEFSNALWQSPYFFEKKWEAKSTSEKAWKDAVKGKIGTAAKDISSIRSVGGKHTAALLDKYFERLSLDEVLEYKKSLDSAERIIESAENSKPNALVDNAVNEDDMVVGYKILKLTGTKSQLSQIIDHMNLMGIEVDELEDGMPKDMEELTVPDFDSFVAFDIETTGTFGVANGDKAPEITEIGAVKVVNGQIVDRFSQLVNPQRRIVPRISRLTNITEAMVRDQPVIEEVIKRFKDFIGDDILVGHNIKNCDIPYITKAAKRAGIYLDNRYFDTYRYAKTLKNDYSWNNTKLEYLAEVFGVGQSDAHRAWCDAETNALVYFKLKDL